MFQFTRKETSVLLFLFITFLLGTGIRVWQHYFQPIPAPVFLKKAKTAGLASDTVYLSTQRQAEEKWVSVKKADTEQIKKIDLNHAGKEELIRIPGIGPVLAERIVQYRNENGDFQQVDDLSRVSGIGSKKQKAFNKYLIIQ